MKFFDSWKCFCNKTHGAEKVTSFKCSEKTTKCPKKKYIYCIYSVFLPVTWSKIKASRCLCVIYPFLALNINRVLAKKHLSFNFLLSLEAWNDVNYWYKKLNCYEVKTVTNSHCHLLLPNYYINARICDHILDILFHLTSLCCKMLDES